MTAPSRKDEIELDILSITIKILFTDHQLDVIVKTQSRQVSTPKNAKKEQTWTRRTWGGLGSNQVLLGGIISPASATSSS